MKTKLSLGLSCFLLLSLSIVPAFGQSAAISYQGQMTEAGNLASGSYDMHFKLFDTVAVGTGVQQGRTIEQSVPVAANGVFSANLDFGAAVFDGAPRFLEISVRRGGGPLSPLGPRQQLVSVPYAIKSLNAATAATALNVASGSAVQSVNNLKDNVTLAAGANVTITPSGNTLTIASSGGSGGAGPWSLLNNNAYYTAGNVGIGTDTPTAGYRLDINGTTILRPSNGSIQFGSPNAELGMSIHPTLNGGNTRADLRFNGTHLKLVAAPGVGPPPPENGLAISTSGYVGIGTANPGFKLEVHSGTSAAIVGRSTFGGGVGVYGESAHFNGVRGVANNLDHGAVVGVHNSGGIGVLGQTAGIGVFGKSLGAGAGVYGESAHFNGVRGLAHHPAHGGVVGVHDGGGIAVYGTGAIGVQGDGTSVGVYARSATGAAVHAEGNATQAPDKGGFVKGMAYIGTNGDTIRCYNGVTGASTGITSSVGVDGVYRVTFPFRVDDRFVSVTAQYGPGNSAANNMGANFKFANSTSIDVFIYDANDGDDTYAWPFMILVF